MGRFEDAAQVARHPHAVGARAAKGQGSRLRDLPAGGQGKDNAGQSQLQQEDIVAENGLASIGIQSTSGPTSGVRRNTRANDHDDRPIDR